MSDSDEPETKRALPARSTRGKRVSQLVGEAAEADEDFWNQAAFQEAASDTEFSSTTPSSDTADTDIDEPESEEDEKSRKPAASRTTPAAVRVTGSTAARPSLVGERQECHFGEVS